MNKRALPFSIHERATFTAKPMPGDFAIMRTVVAPTRWQRFVAYMLAPAW